MDGKVRIFSFFDEVENKEEGNGKIFLINIKYNVQDSEHINDIIYKEYI